MRVLYEFLAFLARLPFLALDHATQPTFTKMSKGEESIWKCGFASMLQKSRKRLLLLLLIETLGYGYVAIIGGLAGVLWLDSAIKGAVAGVVVSLIIFNIVAALFGRAFVRDLHDKGHL
jgi:hypothetical protein